MNLIRRYSLNGQTEGIPRAPDNGNENREPPLQRLRDQLGSQLLSQKYLAGSVRFVCAIVLANLWRDRTLRFFGDQMDRISSTHSYRYSAVCARPNQGARVNAALTRRIGLLPRIKLRDPRDDA